MIQTTIYIKRPNSVKSPLYIDITFDGQRIQAPIGLTIEPRLWDNKKKDFTEKSKRLSNYLRIINNIYEDVIQYYFNQRKNKETVERTAIQLIIANNNSTPIINEHETKNEFASVAAEYLDVKSKIQTKASLYIYKITIEEVINFLKENKRPLHFDSIDHTFFDSYITYLLEIKNNNSNGLKPVGYSNDTIHKRISNIKTFMKWAFERGFHSNLTYQKISYKKTQKHEIVSLSKIELSQIKDLDLSKNVRLEKVRDLFVFGIYTGQRWSDIATFRSEDLEGTDWIFNAQKTRKRMIVPLDGFGSPALKILQKYDYVLPVISGQKFNDYIKEVGKLAQINEKVKINRYSGVIKIPISKPKYEFMASHMARRTCVTLLLEAGIAPTTIMKLTGHSDLKTLLKYENTSIDSLKSALNNITI
jgi:integrase